MIRVAFDDMTEQDFVTVADAEQGILDSFNESCEAPGPVLPQSIIEYDENGQEKRHFSCEWAITLVEV